MKNKIYLSISILVGMLLIFDKEPERRFLIIAGILHIIKSADLYLSKSQEDV